MNICKNLDCHVHIFSECGLNDIEPLQTPFELTFDFGIVQNMDWTGLDSWTGQLDWTVGLNNWTGQLDWTIGLDNWTGQLDWTIGLDFEWDFFL